MQVTRERLEDVDVVRVEGWIDATTAKDFERELMGLFDQAPKQVIVDFGALAYISSAGLRVVLGAAKQMRTLRGGFALFGASPAVARVFELSGFARIIPMVDSEGDAISLVREVANGKA